MISSHTAWPNSKGSSRDSEEKGDSSVKIISGKREMNGYYCTLPRNLSHRYFFKIHEPCHDTYSVLFYKRS